MGRKRVIPVLLLHNKGLYKTTRFANPSYVGDPINAIKIFNEKEVDELIVLDIDASRKQQEPDFDFIRLLTGECFMPLTYGGGVTRLDHIRRLNEIGVEKVAVNTAALDNPAFIEQAAAEFGTSTIVVSADVKKDFWGKYLVYGRNGSQKSRWKADEFIRQMQDSGAGEILVNSIDLDGTMQGYDLKLLELVCAPARVPIIACGGASGLEDMKKAIRAGASAVAAGSLFVYYGRNRAVLINYPAPEDIRSLGVS